jgi:hypothetical protein
MQIFNFKQWCLFEQEVDSLGHLQNFDFSESTELSNIIELLEDIGINEIVDWKIENEVGKLIFRFKGLNYGLLMDLNKNKILLGQGKEVLYSSTIDEFYSLLQQGDLLKML